MARSSPAECTRAGAAEYLTLNLRHVSTDSGQYKPDEMQPIVEKRYLPICTLYARRHGFGLDLPSCMAGWVPDHQQCTVLLRLSSPV